MAQVEEDIRSSGYHYGKLLTCESNPAKKLFEAVGYQVTGLEDGWYQLEKSFRG